VFDPAVSSEKEKETSKEKPIKGSLSLDDLLSSSRSKSGSLSWVFLIQDFLI
jgi:hypothetical protein